MLRIPLIAGQHTYMAAILCQVFGGAIACKALSLIDESAWAAADLIFGERSPR